MLTASVQHRGLPVWNPFLPLQGVFGYNRNGFDLKGFFIPYQKEIPTFIHVSVLLAGGSQRKPPALSCGLNHPRMNCWATELQHSASSALGSAIPPGWFELEGLGDVPQLCPDSAELGGIITAQIYWLCSC